MNLFVALLRVQTVIRGGDQGRVSPETQRFGDRLAAQIVGPGVVRRVKVGENEDFHKAGAWIKR
jgi:hypothetical protein